MKASSLRGEVKKRRFRRTTESRHHDALAADLLMARGQTEGVWVSDITFVPTAEGWLYVAVVMDLHSRKILGLSMRETLSQELTSAALQEAVGRQRPAAGLIHHSDRGRQYASYAYQALLNTHGITPSMGRRGHCYDNAYAESFFGTLKTELVHGEWYRTRQDARLSIFEYVQVFYNRQRRHSALGYRSPEQYEQLGRET
jgi:putative transposase